MNRTNYVFESQVIGMNDQNGFTLIEVMMAAVIFAIGILAVGAMQLGAIKTNASANMTTDAYTLASEEVEEYMRTAWNTTLPITNGPDTSVVPYTVNSVIDWNSTAEVTQRIDVTVLWQHRGTDKRIRVSHLRSMASM